MHFSECGSKCEPECVPNQETCLGECVPKCICDSGYILFEGICIKSDHCRLPTSNSECHMELAKAGKSRTAGNVDAFVPNCSPNGDWSLAQCSAATGYCWCSTPAGQEQFKIVCRVF